MKTRELDRQRAEKTKEIQRLTEDLEKDKRESADLQESLPPMDAALKESNAKLNQLNLQKKQLAKMAEVAGLQIDAEALKVEGLKMLADAQNKQIAAITARMGETDVRTEIERVRINPVKKSPESADRSAMELDRKLDRAQRASSSARVDARESMAAATAKLLAASVADTKARARAAELGVPIANLPAPVQEAVEPLNEIDPLKESDPAKEATPAPASPTTPAAEAGEVYPRAEAVHPELLPKNH